MSPAADILAKILADHRRHLAAAKARVPIHDLRARAAARGQVNSLSGALTAVSAAGLGVIAELKCASPSGGILRESFDVEELAGELAAAGACALSVLTERDSFQGRDEFLLQVRALLPRLPLLRKDFLLDPWQVWESRALGADAVLLMASLLDDALLAAMLAAAEEAGLEALVEVHGGDELARVCAAGVRLIGVNARDLHTFRLNLDSVVDLGAAFPAGVVRVGESGVSGAGDLRRLRAAGYHGALVGSALMRSARPGRTLARWLDQLAVAERAP